jgi:hypothetical protein
MTASAYSLDPFSNLLGELSEHLEGVLPPDSPIAAPGDLLSGAAPLCANAAAAWSLETPAGGRSDAYVAPTWQQESPPGDAVQKLLDEAAQRRGGWAETEAGWRMQPLRTTPGTGSLIDL